MDSTLLNRTPAMLGPNAMDTVQLHTYSNVDLWRLWWRIAGLLAVALYTNVAAWLARIRERNELRELDARTLRDIGISRERVAQEIEKPFWVA